MVFFISIVASCTLRVWGWPIARPCGNHACALFTNFFLRRNMTAWEPAPGSALAVHVPCMQLTPGTWPSQVISHITGSRALRGTGSRHSWDPFTWHQHYQWSTTPKDRSVHLRREIYVLKHCKKKLWTYLYYVYIFILIFYTIIFLDVEKYKDVTNIINIIKYYK